MPDKQLSFFDLDEGERRKDLGMTRALEARRALLRRAQGIAERIANAAGTVTADDVHMAMKKLLLDPGALGNAAGSLFSGKKWSFTGQWKKSPRASNHARLNRVWRLATPEEAIG